MVTLVASVKLVQKIAPNVCIFSVASEFHRIVIVNNLIKG